MDWTVFWHNTVIYIFSMLHALEDFFNNVTLWSYLFVIIQSEIAVKDITLYGNGKRPLT